LNAFLDDLQLCAPLFALIGAGWLLARWPRWPASATAWLGKLVFSVALPALLFGMMSDLSRLPPVDWRVLLAFFGSCLIVFALGRWVAWRWFGMDGVAQSLFGLAGVFSNNALLGLPLAKLTLGDEALPTVALVLVFNSLTLWTLVTVSVEWARQGSLSLQGLGATVRSVLSNPLIIGILSGTAVGLSGWALPPAVRIPLTWVGDGAAPLALLAQQPGHDGHEAAGAAFGGVGPGRDAGPGPHRNPRGGASGLDRRGGQCLPHGPAFQDPGRAGSGQPGDVDRAVGLEHAFAAGSDRVNA